MEAITFLPCGNLEATSNFYLNYFGLKLAVDQGACQVFRVAKNAYWGFCTHITPLETPNSVVLTLVRDDVDEMYQHFIGLGLVTDGAPRWNERFGIYHFFVQDPDGYRVEIQRFRDTRWDMGTED